MPVGVTNNDLPLRGIPMDSQEGFLLLELPGRVLKFTAFGIR